VDLLRAAAEREGIRLEWILAPEGPERALVSGKVDLWPLMADLPERREFLYVTAPWSRMGYAMVFPRALAVRRPEDLAGKTLAATIHISGDRHTAARFFPNSRVLAVQTPGDVMGAVCRGATEAGFLSLNAITDTRPAPCTQRDLRVQPLEEATYWFGIGASEQSAAARAAADRLREAIGHMAEQGALVDIDFRWGTRFASEVFTVFSFYRTLAYERVLTAGLATLVAAFALMVWLVFRLRVARRQAQVASHA
jgi:ABC-type amino acid transport substrate-binding protein